MILFSNLWLRRAFFCILLCSCLVDNKAQNVWKLYYNTKEVQIRSYTSKGQLRHLVQSDDYGNKVDSVIYKKNIYVYSFAKTKVYKNSNFRVINFYSKFKLHKETFLSPYVKHAFLLEEYISDLQNIYESILPNGDEVSNHISISINKNSTHITFRNLNCRFNVLFSPVILQSYLSYDIIKDIKLYTKFGRLSKISYILEGHILNIFFNYKHNSIKIVIESLSSYDDRKDEYIYEWKRDT